MATNFEYDKLNLKAIDKRKVGLIFPAKYGITIGFYKQYFLCTIDGIPFLTQFEIDTGHESAEKYYLEVYMQYFKDFYEKYNKESCENVKQIF